MKFKRCKNKRKKDNKYFPWRGGKEERKKRDKGIKKAGAVRAVVTTVMATVGNNSGRRFLG